MLPAGARFEPVNGNRCWIEQGSTFCQSSDRVAWQVCLRSCVPYFSTLERRKKLDEKRIYSKVKASEALKCYTVGRIIIILSCSGLFSTKNFRPFFPPINMESSGCFHMQFASYKCFNRQFHCNFYDRYCAHPLQSEPYKHLLFIFSCMRCALCRLYRTIWPILKRIEATTTTKIVQCFLSRPAQAP